MGKYCLTIAGFDPSGGAGLNADIKVFNRFKVHGLSVCSAITIQSEDVFESVEWISVEVILRQLKLLLSQYDVGFVKIGLIQNQTVLAEIVNCLKQANPAVFILWDPILKASAGFDFDHFKQGCSAGVFRYIDLITPNHEEYSALGLSKSSPFDILKTGGRTNADVLITDAEDITFETKAVVGDKHGTGCVLSAVIVAHLANGGDLPIAIRAAKDYVATFITSDLSLLGFHE